MVSYVDLMDPQHTWIRFPPELCGLYDKNKVAFKKYLGPTSCRSPDLHVWSAL